MKMYEIFKRTMKTLKNKIIYSNYIMGRPRKYFTKEEGNEANRPTKTKYMLNKEWICLDCGKWNHLKTKKHMKNAQVCSQQKV